MTPGRLSRSIYGPAPPKRNGRNKRANCPINFRNAPLYAASLWRQQISPKGRPATLAVDDARPSHAAFRSSRIASSAACRIAGSRRYPPSWVEATSRWNQWFMGRPLQRVLRSGASLPGAGPRVRLPGIHRARGPSRAAAKCGKGETGMRLRRIPVLSLRSGEYLSGEHPLTHHSPLTTHHSPLTTFSVLQLLRVLGIGLLLSLT
jgi:hypothetical protein